MGIFDNIDFENLPSNFREDSVREEIVTPLLNSLGYDTFKGNNKIIRSPRLKHPFVYFGTKSSKVNMIPDYLIQVNGKNAFIIDAKSPSENIINGKNFEQAYSYCIHPDVRVDKFVLCNGKELSIFDTIERKLILYIKLNNINSEDASKLFDLLSPDAFINPNIFNYKLDYGIWCKNNLQNYQMLQNFYDCYIIDIARLDDNTFTFSAIIKMNGIEYIASFDFDISLFDDFMRQVPEYLSKKVKDYLRKSPFHYVINNKDESFSVKFSAGLSDVVLKNENEHYIPFVVKRFF